MENSKSPVVAIKNWAADDQPREKLMTKGTQALSDSELLAILLRTGGGGDSALGLAQRILADCRYSLDLLSKQSAEQLMKYKGMGPAKAVTIVAALELGRRRKGGKIDKLILKTSRIGAQFCRNLLADYQQEVFLVIFLKTNSQVIDYKILFQGGMNKTIVDPKVIFQHALTLKATQIILCHNHPSGNMTPSHSDLLMTDQIVKGGKLLEIKVVDHFIVSDQGYYSFADEGKI